MGARMNCRLLGLAVTLVVTACRSEAPRTQATQVAKADDPRATAPGGTSAGSGTFQGREIAPTMSYLGAAWLDRPERADREQPDRVLDALALPRDSVVADVGAGTGYFTLRLAARVAQVHATDLQPEMLQMLGARVKAAGLTNVVLHAATARDSGLPAACCDLVLLVDVYHELADPTAVMGSIRRALRSRGRLVLVEYRGEDPAVAIKPEHKVTLDQLKLELSRLDFALVESLEFLPDQRVVIFTATD